MLLIPHVENPESSEDRYLDPQGNLPLQILLLPICRLVCYRIYRSKESHARQAAVGDGWLP